MLQPFFLHPWSPQKKICFVFSSTKCSTHESVVKFGEWMNEWMRSREEAGQIPARSLIDKNKDIQVQSDECETHSRQGPVRDERGLFPCVQWIQVWWFPWGVLWYLVSSVPGCMKTQGGNRPHLLVGLGKAIFLLPCRAFPIRPWLAGVADQGWRN